MKTQMKFQKRLCLLLVILGAVMIVYAALYKTGMLAALGSLCNLERGETLGYTQAQVFFDSESFNTALLWLGIAVLLAACLLYVFACHKRRNYYITNYIISILVAVVNVVVAVVVVVYNTIYYSACLDVIADQAFLDEWYAYATGDYADVWRYSTNTAMFIIGYVLCLLLIVGAVFLILNMLWKRKLMAGEKKLLNESFAEEVA